MQINRGFIEKQQSPQLSREIRSDRDIKGRKTKERKEKKRRWKKKKKRKCEGPNFSPLVMRQIGGIH